MATCKLVTSLIGEIDNQVRLGNYLSRSEFIRYAIKTLEKNPLIIDSMIALLNQFLEQIITDPVQKLKTETKVVSFKLPQESANRLNMLSEQKNLSRSEIIRLGIILLILEEKRLSEQLNFRSCPLCGSFITTEMDGVSSEIDQISPSQLQK